MSEAVKERARESMLALVAYADELERENTRLRERDELMQEVLRGTRAELVLAQERIEELVGRSKARSPDPPPPPVRTESANHLAGPGQDARQVLCERIERAAIELEIPYERVLHQASAFAGAVLTSSRDLEALPEEALQGFLTTLVGGAREAVS